MEVKSFSSNWKKLQQSLKKDSAAPPPPAGTASAVTNGTVNGTRKRKTAPRSDQPDADGRHALKRKRSSTLSESRRGQSQAEAHAEAPRQKAAAVSAYRKKRIMASQGGEGEGAVTTDGKGTDSGLTVETGVQQGRNSRVNEGLAADVEVGKYLAMDCEMVGVGPNPDNDSALARVSIVNYNGDQVYDSFVRPKEMVTDWRTHVSGVSPKHMVNARTFEDAQAQVAKLLEGNVLVGHAVRNDLDALLLSHPKRDIRDTSRHPPYRKVAGGNSPRLKILAAEFLGLEIQDGAHSSVEDARATMLLFRRDKAGFDREHAKKWPVRVTEDAGNEKGEGSGGKKKKKPKKKSRKR